MHVGATRIHTGIDVPRERVLNEHNFMFLPYVQVRSSVASESGSASSRPAVCLRCRVLYRSMYRLNTFATVRRRQISYVACCLPT